MATIKIPYGDEELTLEIPDENLLSVLMPRDLPKVENEEAEIRRAIEHPIKSKHLSEIVSPGKTVGIAIDDITRVTPKWKIVPVLLEMLNDIGVRDEDVKIVVAIGTHRSDTEEEMKKMVTPEVYERVEVTNHDCDNKDKLAYLGETSMGTPVWVNKTIAKSDVKIGVGGITIHALAGFSGGAKIVLPGISSRETIAHNHPMGIGHPKVRLGNIEGNIVRYDMEEAARILKLDMIVNTVVNTKAEIVRTFAGDVIAVHREGAEFCRRNFGVKTPRLADVVVSSSAPKSITWGQGYWALETGNLCVKRGGTLIYMVPAYEGISHAVDWVKDLKRALTPEEVKAEVKAKRIKDYANVDVLYEVAVIRTTKHLINISDGVSKSEFAQMGMECAENLYDAIKEAFSRQGKEAKFTILPFGSITLPIVEQAC